MVLREKRRYERYPGSHGIDITSPTGNTKTYTTLNISDGGIFVLAVAGEQLPVGTEVTIAPTLFTPEEERPTMKGRVACRSRLGMGIEFLDLRFT